MFLVVTPGTGNTKSAFRKEWVHSIVELEKGCRIYFLNDDKFGITVQESFLEVMGQLERERRE